MNEHEMHDGRGCYLLFTQANANGCFQGLAYLLARDGGQVSRGQNAINDATVMRSLIRSDWHGVGNLVLADLPTWGMQDR